MPKQPAAKRRWPLLRTLSNKRLPPASRNLLVFDLSARDWTKWPLSRCLNFLSLVSGELKSILQLDAPSAVSSFSGFFALALNQPLADAQRTKIYNLFDLFGKDVRSKSGKKFPPHPARLPLDKAVQKAAAREKHGATVRELDALRQRDLSPAELLTALKSPRWPTLHEPHRSLPSSFVLFKLNWKTFKRWRSGNVAAFREHLSIVLAVLELPPLVRLTEHRGVLCALLSGLLSPRDHRRLQKHLASLPKPARPVLEAKTPLAKATARAKRLSGAYDDEHKRALRSEGRTAQALLEIHKLRGYLTNLLRHTCSHEPSPAQCYRCEVREHLATPFAFKSGLTLHTSTGTALDSTPGNHTLPYPSKEPDMRSLQKQPLDNPICPSCQQYITIGDALKTTDGPEDQRENLVPAQHAVCPPKAH